MITNISFKFKLFDANNLPVDSMNIFVQYFNLQENLWITLYKENIINGVLNVEDVGKSRVKTRKEFYNKIKTSEIPECRIIPETPLFNLDKQEVLSFAYEIEYVESESKLILDFGSAWLLDAESVINNNHYKNFFWVTSPFLLARQNESTTSKSTKSKVNKSSNLGKNIMPNIAYATIDSAQYATLIDKDFASILIQDINNANFDQFKDDPKLSAILLLLERSKIELIRGRENFNSIDAAFEEMKQINSQLISSNTNLSNTNQTLFNRNTDLELENATLKDQIENLSQGATINENSVKVNDIFTNIVKDLDTSNEETKLNNFSIGNLSIKLKGFLSLDATNNLNIKLPTNNSASQINTEAVSDISFDVFPSSTQTLQRGIVPNVLGLTETAVTRILESIGLKLNPVYQYNLNKPHGISFKQVPLPDSPINPNEFVTVIFSKKNE